MKYTRAKAVAAAVGATLTALTTMLATVSVVIGDDAIDASEVGILATAAVTLASTVFAVWKVENKRISNGPVAR